MKLIDYLRPHGSKTVLARQIKAQPQLVWQWASGARPVPIGRCMAIEQATNGVVSRVDLRMDWAEIWPELTPIQTVAPESASTPNHHPDRRDPVAQPYPFPDLDRRAPVDTNDANNPTQEPNHA